MPERETPLAAKALQFLAGTWVALERVDESCTSVRHASLERRFRCFRHCRSTPRTTAAEPLRASSRSAAAQDSQPSSKASARRRRTKSRFARDTITAIVTVTDDGGSSGRLRREFGVLPPGDVRNCLAALASPDSPFKQLLQHRFDSTDGMHGHPMGNLLLTALTQITGDFSEAVSRLSEMVGLRGRVLPTTRENVRLRAEMESGQIVTGETAIVAKRLANPPAVARSESAAASRRSSRARQRRRHRRRPRQPLHEPDSQPAGRRHRVDDLWRQRRPDLRRQPDDRAGETDHYTLDDHLRAIRLHAGFDLFDYILVNQRPLESDAAAAYAEQGARPVKVLTPLRWAGKAQVVECDLAVEYGERKIRHQPSSVARAMRALVRAGRP